MRRGGSSVCRRVVCLFFGYSPKLVSLFELALWRRLYKARPAHRHLPSLTTEQQQQQQQQQQHLEGHHSTQRPKMARWA